MAVPRPDLGHAWGVTLSQGGLVQGTWKKTVRAFVIPLAPLLGWRWKGQVKGSLLFPREWYDLGVFKTEITIRSSVRRLLIMPLVTWAIRLFSITVNCFKGST